jgi:hypothetical protein
MRLVPWFAVFAALVTGSALNAQQKIGLSFGLGSQWTAIPGGPDLPGLARGMWGGSATLELSSANIPRFAFVTHVTYAPDRATPAAPRMLSVGGGLRYVLAAGRHLSMRPSVEFEALRFTAVDAYNAVVRTFTCTGSCPGDISFGYNREGWLMDEGWRLGVSFHPTVQVWPAERVGFELTPAIRWLVPVSRSLPPSNHDRYTDPLYLTLGVGVLFKLGGR